MKQAREVEMNCRAIRERLNEAFAAGQADVLEHGNASHLQACGECRDYYNSQSRLYGAIDSGVRRLVENAAPPSLLPRVRDRVAAAQPQMNRAWVRALVPSSVALLVATGLLLLIPSPLRKADKIASVQQSPLRNNDSATHERAGFSSREAPTIISKSHPAKSHPVSLKPEHQVATSAAVIIDPRETAAFAPMAKEIARDPELGLRALGRAASTANQAEAIEPLNIARLDIPVLAGEKE